MGVFNPNSEAAFLKRSVFMKVRTTTRRSDVIMQALDDIETGVMSK